MTCSFIYSDRHRVQPRLQTKSFIFICVSLLLQLNKSKALMTPAPDLLQRYRSQKSEEINAPLQNIQSLVTYQKAAGPQKVKLQQSLISQMERRQLPVKQQRSAKKTPQSWWCPSVGFSHLGLWHLLNLNLTTKCLLETKPNNIINLFLIGMSINRRPLHNILHGTHWSTYYTDGVRVLFSTRTWHSLCTEQNSLSLSILSRSSKCNQTCYKW